MNKLDSLRQQILQAVKEYSTLAFEMKPFQPGVSSIPASGKVLDQMEIMLMVDAALDGWLTTGRFNEQFQTRLAEFLAVRYAMTVNSGSSANLLAFTCLCSSKLGSRAIQPGDEVITVATGFPTTVNPIMQNGAIPVFVDVEIPTYNIDVRHLEAALSPRTRAIMLAHTLGNPFDLGQVTAFCKKHHLWLVEDCCDALGSTYQGRGVGTFGDVGTLSFYPAHHITMGEGGAVFTANPLLKQIIESYRDWGRDCYCLPGHDNTCGKRFGWKLGDLPLAYDHKYTYSHAGYNLKITDMQAACALAQLDKLPTFIAARKRNFALLHTGLADLQQFLVLPEPTPGSDPSWFGFPITIRDGAPFTRADLIHHLEEKKIGTRLLFAGNLIRQPYMRGRQYRVVGELTSADRVMNQSLWLGVYPGLSTSMITYVLEQIHQLARKPPTKASN